MGLGNLIIILLVVGIGLWALKFVTFIDPTFKRIIKIVCVVGVVFLILRAFGFWDALNTMRLSP